MKGFLRAVDNISKSFIWPCSVILGVLTILVFIGVISRYAFNAPLKWVPETIQFMFGAAWLLCGAALIITRQHIRIDILVSRFSRRTQAIIECANSLGLWTFVGVLLYYASEMAWKSFKAQETAGTFWDPPLWPIRIAMALGVFLMLLQGAAKFIRDFHIATRGKGIEE